MFKMSKEDLELSQAARDLQNNPAYSRAFKDVEAVYLHAIKESGLKDKDGREVAYYLLRALGDVKKHLENRVSEGDAYLKVIDKDILQFKKGVR